MFEPRRRSVKFYLAWANIFFWGTLALIFIFVWLMRGANDPRRIAQFASHTAVPGSSSDPIGVITGNAEAVLSPPAATAAPPEVGYEDKRTPQGILAAYEYTQRVVNDPVLGFERAATREQPDVNLPGQWPVTAQDVVAVIETVNNNDGRWFKIAILKSKVDKRYEGQTGYIMAWLIDNTDVPPKPADPTPTVEPSPEPATQAPADTPTEAPAPTAAPEPEATASVFDNQPAVPVFNMKVVPNSGDIGSDPKGCIEGHVLLHRGATQVSVLFKHENAFVSANVDSNGYYRKCDLAGGLWEATIDTLAGTAFTGTSYQQVQVVEGQVSNASWYEQ